MSPIDIALTIAFRYVFLFSPFLFPNQPPRACARAAFLFRAPSFPAYRGICKFSCLFSVFKCARLIRKKGERCCALVRFFFFLSPSRNRIESALHIIYILALRRRAYMYICTFDFRDTRGNKLANRCLNSQLNARTHTYRLLYVYIRGVLNGPLIKYTPRRRRHLPREISYSPSEAEKAVRLCLSFFSSLVRSDEGISCSTRRSIYSRRRRRRLDRRSRSRCHARAVMAMTQTTYAKWKCDFGG